MASNRDFKIRGYTIGQSPNLPLIVLVVGGAAGRLMDQGSAGDRVADFVFCVGLSIWSYLETFYGVNGFRKCLGVAGFLLLLRFFL